VTAAERTADARLQKLYGITLEQYGLILEYQGGCCAICERTAESMPVRMNVDHDHKTRQVRGLLCPWCNHKRLPAMRDSVKYAENTAEYLRNFPAVGAIGVVISPEQPPNKRRRRK
jgi:DNA-directed RNA polymerase subunit RPC12/RpoP